MQEKKRNILKYFAEDPQTRKPRIQHYDVLQIDRIEIGHQYLYSG